MRLILAATLGLVCAGAVQATPLCRDSKGLFTPCPPGREWSAGYRHKTHTTWPDRATAGRAPDTGDAAPQGTKTGNPDRSAKLLLAHKAKLCRDSKGLFKPC